ncbi:hypothetical protein AMTRI_Chr09g36200 [Amborella trichopoda]|uniref:Rhamnogalacturonase A/B/Epimerase-like pectate lyase domain-containing protein n=1 Tax=Amborella trichopoda TaxID=13333 RepID=W1NMG2_AMBTC|nr:probable polygalacturonase [Amborella trichopoda]ERM96479.1 hypothetical protein AMTR_s00001p00258260 [Amborella trichopoda]|eukprot:XP_006829063.1 probable polygalacturonase [Amborella trichopoda]
MASSPSQITSPVWLLTRVLILVSAFFAGIDGRKTKLSDEGFTYFQPRCRTHVASLTDFGGVGDGVTSNTNAFQAAVSHLSQFASDGGALLYVPPGKWLTGCFNITSFFTLYLNKDAVILASQDMNEWPIIPPLPSYGVGRDTPGPRYSSLISGFNLTDVVITGDNGTIDGQGQMWWQKFRQGALKHTRGYLIEILFSDQVIISSLTLINSPSWNVHPVYSSNVIVKGITISAPVTSPNTDGINPDSCTHVRIEDCNIVSGDDCIAIKSGWDEYGIAFGMPSQHIIIRRLFCVSPFSAVIALGSEMSGGIQDVRAQDIQAVNSEAAVRIKTSPGRGGFVKDIYVKGMNLENMKWVFTMTGSYGSHPDNKWDPNAFPVVSGINYRDVISENVTIAGKLEGIPKAPFGDICISNVTIGMSPKSKKKKLPWNCTYVSGTSSGVTPTPCSLLPESGYGDCPFPTDRDPIDDVEFQACSSASYRHSHTHPLIY